MNPAVSPTVLILLGGMLACGAVTSSSVGTAPRPSVGVVPPTAQVAALGTQQFGASVTGIANTAVTWSVPDCGTVDQTGFYTAPVSTGTCHVVVASQADPAETATAVVTVTATATAAWRPFNESSPWNTPIPADPPLEADSAQLITNFIASTPYGPHLDVNIPGYSIPLYWADASTESYPVYAALGGEGWNGWPATADMPIPPGATPDPLSDHHMLVISPDRTTEYGCYDMVYDATASPQWSAQLCATADLTGTGVRTPAPLANPWWLAHGARACGFPLVAGLIRVEEIEAGEIDHALVIAYPGIQPNHFTPPASTPSAIGNAPDGVGVPCGGQFQYDPSVDLTTLGLSRAGLIIMRALQTYGAYVGDYSGALSLYAENSDAAKAYWASGVLNEYELEGKIDLNSFRIIQYGTMY